MNRDEFYMKKAIKLALKAKGHTSPNPLVGALIVKNDKIIGKGYHSGPGHPHAEIEALKNLKGDLKNAIMYITLEPCNFYGKTPPCVVTLEKLPFKKFVIGIKDVNPRVNGKSIKRLIKKGFEVDYNILADDINAINPYYPYYMKNKQTFFYMKIAQSVNGYIAYKNIKKKYYITSLKSRKFVHRLRYDFDAILIGATTVNIDNPLLDTRLYNNIYKPKIIILDFHNILNYRRKIFIDKTRKKIIFVNKRYEKKLEHRNDVDYIFIKNKNDVWDIMKYDFIKYNIFSIMIEGGGKVFTNALKNSIINKLGIFIAPILINNGIRAMEGIDIDYKWNLKDMKKIGNDLYLEYLCSQDL